MIEVIATVALFGLANLGALIFLLGSLKSKVDTLEDWAGKFNCELADVQRRTAVIEGKLA